jgi:hypothetical protein
MSYPRQLKSHKVVPRELCKQEMLTFIVWGGDHVYLKVSPMKGVKRFGVKGKLSPCYIRQFLILKKSGNVAYKMELPPSLARVHDIFHVSQLKKCLKEPVDVVLP